MRLIIVLNLLFLFFKAVGQVPAPKSGVADIYEKPHDKTVIRLRCAATITNSPEPMLIIDGLPVEYEKLKSLDPNEIESVSVLKDSRASTLYGCRAVNGVIIITTKRRSFQVRDMEDGNSIAGATVRFVSATDKKDTLILATNENGALVTNSIKKGQLYNVTISSVGYKSLTVLYNDTVGAAKVFSLERQVVNCSPVVVCSYSSIRCWRAFCGSITTKNCGYLKRNGYESTTVSNVIYPNPVQRGLNLTIILDQTSEAFISVRSLNTNGQLLLSQSNRTVNGMNRFMLNIDHRWAAGVYFLQLADEKGSIIKQEKIIVQ